mgnify:CR=1 FL=1
MAIPQNVFALEQLKNIETNNRLQICCIEILHGELRIILTFVVAS